MNKFDKILEEARVKKTDVTKKVAKELYNDYWNIHSRVVESLRDSQGDKWVDENFQEIQKEIDFITDAYYDKITKRK